MFRRLADLQVGSLVKVLAARGTGILPGVVRYSSCSPSIPAIEYIHVRTIAMYILTVRIKIYFLLKAVILLTLPLNRGAHKKCSKASLFSPLFLAGFVFAHQKC